MEVEATELEQLRKELAVTTALMVKLFSRACLLISYTNNLDEAAPESSKSWRDGLKFYLTRLDEATNDILEAGKQRV
jgi:hypothetical protein